jgi:hypothetical protein
MAPVFGFESKDVERIGRAVREYESAPPRLPLGEGGHVKTQSRVVLFEIVSEEPDVDGLWDVKILRRKPTGGYEAVSTIKAKLEELNA